MLHTSLELEFTPTNRPVLLPSQLIGTRLRRRGSADTRLDRQDDVPGEEDLWPGCGLLWRCMRTGNRSVPAGRAPTSSGYAILPQLTGFFSGLLEVGIKH